MYETDFPEYGQQCELVTPWRGYHRGTIVGRTAKNLLSPDGAWLKSGIVRTMARAWASRMQAGKPDGVRARQRVA